MLTQVLILIFEKSQKGPQFCQQMSISIAQALLYHEQTSRYLLPPTSYLLPATYYLLPTTYYATTYYITYRASNCLEGSLRRARFR